MMRVRIHKTAYYFLIRLYKNFSFLHQSLGFFSKNAFSQTLRFFKPGSSARYFTVIQSFNSKVQPANCFCRLNNFSSETT